MVLFLKDIKSNTEFRLINFAQDGALAGGLLTAPAWAPMLSTFNDFLTSATLIVGLIFALVRLRTLFTLGKKNKNKQD